MDLSGLKNSRAWTGFRQTLRSEKSALTLYLPRGWPESRAAVRWWWHDNEDALHSGQVSDLEELPAQSRAGKLHVWTPGTDTLLITAVLPTQARTKILQALPFALEDQLLGEPESLHYAYRPLGDNRLAVAVTARERLKTWLEGLAQAGLQPSSLCPITLAVPLEPSAEEPALIADSWSLAFSADEIWLRSGPFSGFAYVAADGRPPAILVTALQEERAKLRAPKQLHIFNPPPGYDAENWAAALALPVMVQQQDIWDGISRLGSHSPPLDYPRGQFPPLNLLQSEFASAGQLRQLSGALRPAGIMFGLWLAGSVVFNLGEWWQLSRAYEAQRAEMTALFRKSFPDAKVVVDPALQMQRDLAALQARSGVPTAGDLVPLLAQVAPVLQTNPQNQLQAIHYADSAITLDLTLPSFQALDNFKNALNATGLRVEVLTANSRPAGVEGRLRVAPKGQS
ncbi:MAG TPA: type II secretion system protein GspL [Acidiferrobacterales bacterium]|nr:type II secretion system protein GspL [Acidiferrobacterales bacterium]